MEKLPTVSSFVLKKFTVMS